MTLSQLGDVWHWLQHGQLGFGGPNAPAVQCQMFFFFFVVVIVTIRTLCVYLTLNKARVQWVQIEQAPAAMGALFSQTLLYQMLWSFILEDLLCYYRQYLVGSNLFGSSCTASYELVLLCFLQFKQPNIVHAAKQTWVAVLYIRRIHHTPLHH